MNLNELAQSIREISNEKLLNDLASYIEEWKKDDRNVEALTTMVERFFGNIWLVREEEQEKAYELWEHFRNSSIKNIDGMTMNERLYSFGLFERFDDCVEESQKLIVYEKLNAKP